MKDELSIDKRDFKRRDNLADGDGDSFADDYIRQLVNE